jgi:tetratricopeptide (TPR) repeat protein
MGIRQEIRMRRAALTTFLGALLVLGTLPLHAQAKAADVKSLLDQGLYSYEEGDYDAAVAAFEKAFAQNPSNDALLNFVEKASVSKIYSMLRSKDPRIAGLGKELLRASSRVITARAADPGEIQKAVQETLAASGEERLLAVIRHTNTHGRNLVPALIPVLGETDLDRRTTAITWIGRIGMDAVPVLQAARKHPDPVIRRVVADVLGVRTVRHPVSLATLKAMMETDSQADVKAAAQKSFRTILADLDGAARDLTAKEYFLDNAYHVYYLDPHKNPFAGSYYVPMVYTLQGDKVVGERVAEFQLSERMAKQALEEALELDPEFLEARVLTLCNDAAQVVEYDLNVDYYAKNESQTDIKELLEKQKPYVDNVLRLRILAAPGNVLNEGLLQALDDGRSDVALKVIETIHDTRRDDAPEALVKALDDPHSRLVRTAAATTLAYWNPASGFNQGDLVIQNLSEAVVSSGVRTAHLVVSDRDQANRLADVLHELNMEGYNPIDGVERAYDAVVSSPPDVVFIDESVRVESAKRASAPINYFVNELRKNYRSAGVPVVVVVPAAKVEDAKRLYENAERKVWVASSGIDAKTLETTILAKLFKEKADAKAHATRLATSAAEALRHLASSNTRMPVKKAAPALMQVLKGRPDVVRLPAIEALGELEIPEAAGQLAAVAANAGYAKEVRVAAMRAVGKSLEGSQGAPPAVLKIIEDGMQETDLDLRRAAWYAFSNAGAPGKSELAALLAPAPAGAAPAAGGGEEKKDAEPAEPEATEPAEPAPAPAEAAEPAEKPEGEAATAEEPAAEEPAAEEPAAEEPAAEDAAAEESK